MKYDNSPRNQGIEWSAQRSTAVSRMRNWLNRIWAGLLLAGLSCALHAVEVQNMYEVRLPVTDQNQDSRRAAFERGFAEVLVRVSGNSKLPGINLAQASAYVQQYRYLLLEATENAAPLKKGEVVATHNLWLKFDDVGINKLLRTQGLSIWGSQRPAVLVWLAVRDGQNRYILREQDASAIRDALMAEGQRRGLPLIWPIYDEKDSKLVQFADVWGGFFETVTQASQRYSASAVLVGRMDWQQKKGWQVDWSLLLEGKQQNWQQRSLDLPVLMAAGINPVANQLASRFAVVENATGVVSSLNMLVKGVNDAEGYARLARYLSSLALVKLAFVTDIAPGEAQFHLELNGGEAELRRTIALGNTLTPDDKTAPVTPQPGMPVQTPVTPVVTSPQPHVATPALLRYRLN